MCTSIVHGIVLHTGNVLLPHTSSTCTPVSSLRIFELGLRYCCSRTVAAGCIFLISHRRRCFVGYHRYHNKSQVETAGADVRIEQTEASKRIMDYRIFCIKSRTEDMRAQRSDGSGTTGSRRKSSPPTTKHYYCYRYAYSQGA